MAIPASFLQSNSLSGSAVVVGGFANINIGFNPVALIGTNNSFVVKLRRGSTSGVVVTTSPPITIQDTSSIVSVTANVSSVAEGNLVSYTVVTSNVTNYSNIYFSVAGATANITSADFTSNTGFVTIVNNTGTFALRANSDLSLMDETGETYQIQIRSGSPTGNVVYQSASSNVTLLDVSKQYNVYSLVESAGSISTPANLIFTVGVTNIPAGTILYYDTVGTASNTTFSSPNTGSFAINTGSNTISFFNCALGVGQSATLAVRIRRDSLTGPILFTSNTVALSGLSAYYSMTGGNITYSNQYKIHEFATSDTLVVSSTSGDSLNAGVDVLIVAGGGGGNYSRSSGAGAGGVLYGTTTSLLATPYTVTVGAGGFGSGNGYTGAGPGGSTQGSPSSLGPAMVANGGGYGSPGSGQGIPGGSGSGASNQASPNTGGSSTQSPAGGLTGYGNSGGAGQPGNFGPYASGGGGGAGGVGGSAVPGTGGNGGVGIAVPWSPPAYGTPGPAPGLKYFAGGGGGGTDLTSGQLGGAGGGARGAYGLNPTPTDYQTSPGTVNTGGGGGGGNRQWFGSDGGSGIVLIRYPYTGFYSNLTANANYYLYGTSNVYFILSAQNANAQVLNYSTVGNVTSDMFIGGNTGTVVVTGNTTIIRMQASATIPSGETRNFSLVVSNSSGYALITSNNTAIIQGPPPNVSTVSYTMVAGGGAGAGGPGTNTGDNGGGGAGGMLNSFTAVTPGTQYTVTVGAGGVNGAPFAVNYTSPGSNTTVSGGALNLIAVGGGGGAQYNNTPPASFPPGGNGGSGGGGLARSGVNAGAGGSGYPGQGNPGGSGSAPNGFSGGGGGAGGSGGASGGGSGLASPITGTLYAGGGGGAQGTNSGAGGGSGGGGPGGTFVPGSPGTGGGTSGTVNTGGGGGTGAPISAALGGSGGSGVTLFAHPNYYVQAATTGANVVVTTVGGNIIYKFYASGTITF